MCVRISPSQIVWDLSILPLFKGCVFTGFYVIQSSEFLAFKCVKKDFDRM